MALPGMTFTLTNESSFALCMMDAMTNYLAGVAEIGSNRAEKFANAKRRLSDALKYSDMAEEREMAQAMIDKIENFESRRLHV